MHVVAQAVADVTDDLDLDRLVGNLVAGFLVGRSVTSPAGDLARQ